MIKRQLPSIFYFRMFGPFSLVFYFFVVDIILFLFQHKSIIFALFHLFLSIFSIYSYFWPFHLDFLPILHYYENPIQNLIPDQSILIMTIKPRHIVYVYYKCPHKTLQSKKGGAVNTLIQIPLQVYCFLSGLMTYGIQCLFLACTHLSLYQVRLSVIRLVRCCFSY